MKKYKNKIDEIYKEKKENEAFSNKWISSLITSYERFKKEKDLLST